VTFVIITATENLFTSVVIIIVIIIEEFVTRLLRLKTDTSATYAKVKIDKKRL